MDAASPEGTLLNYNNGLCSTSRGHFALIHFKAFPNLKTRFVKKNINYHRKTTDLLAKSVLNYRLSAFHELPNISQSS
jgi:hypothetical protein